MVRTLGADDVRRLLETKAGRGSVGQRNRALVRVFADAGIGVSEALSLLPDDLDEPAGQVKIEGRRGRSIEVSDAAMRDLVAWRTERERLGLGGGPLFCTEGGQPLEPSYVRRFLTRLGRRANIDTPVNARSLRESFVAMRVANGASADTLQADLGHARRESTARYVGRLVPTAPAEVVPAPSALTETMLTSAHCGLVVVRAVRSPGGEIADFVIDYANPAGAGILRSTPGRLVGTSVLERFPNAAGDGTFSRWKALIAEQGRSGDDARRYEDVDGGSVFRVRRAACGDRVVLSFEDLTEIRGAEAREDLSEARRVALLGAAEEGLLLLDSDGRISSANRAAESILGIPIERLVGRTPADPRWRALREDGSEYPPEELPAEITIATGRPVRAQVVGVRHARGEVAWMRVSTHALEALGGPPFAVAVALTDLSELRCGAAETLGNSQALDLAMKWSGGLLLRCLPDGTILAASGNASALVGLSCDELRGRRCEEAVHPEDAPAVRRAYLRAMEQGDDVELEHRVLGSSGSSKRVRRVLRAVHALGETVEVHSLLTAA